QSNTRADVAGISRIDLALHPIGPTLEIVGGWLFQEGNSTEPLDAPSADPARDQRPERKAVHRAQRVSVELAREYYLVAQRLGQLDRGPESKPLTLALYQVQAHEFDVPSPVRRPHRLEQVAQGEPGPLTGAGGFRP